MAGRMESGRLRADVDQLRAHVDAGGTLAVGDDQQVLATLDRLVDLVDQLGEIEQRVAEITEREGGDDAS
jgi:ribosome assembly protein YihI (activator of Der GTPase)